MENKNQKIGLIIILSTVLFLAIIFIGITYAFFTANNPEGSTAQIISETGRMVINYDDGTDIIQPVTGIVPSNAIIVNKTFSLTGSKSIDFIVSFSLVIIKKSSSISFNEDELTALLTIILATLLVSFSA